MLCTSSSVFYKSAHSHNTIRWLAMTACALLPSLQLHSSSSSLLPSTHSASITPSESQGSLGWPGRWRGLYLEAHLPLWPPRNSLRGGKLSVCLSESPVNLHYPQQHCTGGLAEYKSPLLLPLSSTLQLLHHPR